MGFWTSMEGKWDMYTILLLPFALCFLMFMLFIPDDWINSTSVSAITSIFVSLSILMGFFFLKECVVNYEGNTTISSAIRKRIFWVTVAFFLISIYKLNEFSITMTDDYAKKFAQEILDMCNSQGHCPQSIPSWHNETNESSYKINGTDIIYTRDVYNFGNVRHDSFRIKVLYSYSRILLIEGRLGDKTINVMITGTPIT